MSRLLALVSVAFVASTAHAGPTKVALAIEGDSSSIGIRKAVVGAFAEEDGVEFISSRKTTHAIEQLGIGEVSSAHDAKTIAKKLAVAAVVQGEFDESDHTLTLTVYGKGKKAGSFTVEAEDTRSPTFQKVVRKKMLAKLDAAAAQPDQGDDDTDVASDKSAKHDKADKKHSHDEDVADDKADKKSAKDKSEKHDKADKKRGHDDDVADDKADKKSGHDDDVADDTANKKSGHKGDKDIADDKADKKSGHKGDKDIADDKADKKSGHKGDKDIADDKADKKSGHKGDKDVADDKADKKRGHDDDVADDKTDNKSGHKGDKDIAADKADKKSGHEGDKDIAADKADKKRGPDEDNADEVASDDEEDDGAADDEDPTSAHAEASPRAPATSRNLAAVRVDLGASLTGRSLRYQSSAGEGAPSAYRAKPVPGGHLEAELYPLAFKDRSSVVSGLGIGGDFDQATSFTMPTADGTAAVKVVERHFSVGARLRIAFGHRATSPTVTLGAGYGARTFAIDHSSGMVTGVPDVDYRMVDPSLVARVPIGRHVTLFAGGRGLLMLSAGPIAKADQYGRAHVTGGTATAGLEIGLGSHVALRLAGEGSQIDMKFYGQGMLSSGLDGNPSTIDVQRARDRYYGGDATIAVIY